MSWRRGQHGSALPQILMIGNNGTPTDRRVWLECLALRDAGFGVSVVSPGTPDELAEERIDGIDVHRYLRPVRSGSQLGFVLRYAAAWFRTARLAWSIWRKRRFAVVQACNPPDTFFTIALLFKPVGVRFVFDQHDLSPEIYRDRFAAPSRWVHRVLLALERWTHRAADHVITVNDSCRDLLLSRTSTPAERLTVIRTGPDLARLVLSDATAELRKGRRFLCAYLGVMGPQDGVDLVLHAVDVLVHELGREDVQFVLMGDGPCLGELVALADELEIGPWIEFTGWADDAVISAVLSSSDLGLQPDRRTPFTDLCTMLKTIEYLAFGLPVVSFDLAETRRSAGDAAVYVADETPHAYARQVAALLDDAAQRQAMAAHALRRAHTELAWDTQKDAYVDVVRSVLGLPAHLSGNHPSGTPRTPRTPGTTRRDSMRYLTGEPA